MVDWPAPLAPLRSTFPEATLRLRTPEEILEVSGGEVTSKEMLRVMEATRPIVVGGLFDPTIFGAGRAGHVRLPEPVAHPLVAGEALTIVPVLPIELRPLAPDHVRFHEVNTLYQRLLAAREGLAARKARGYPDQELQVFRKQLADRLENVLRALVPLSLAAGVQARPFLAALALDVIGS